MKSETLFSHQPTTVIYSDTTASLDAQIVSALSNEFHLVHSKDLLHLSKRVDQTKTSCIIMSLEKPYVATFQAVSALKSDYRTFHIPIILLVTHLNDQDIAFALEMGADDFVPVPFTAEQLRMRTLLNVARRARDLQAHPLTHLAGSKIIDHMIEQRLTQPMSLLYVDLDNFKAYNDYYGFTRGDLALQQVAQLLINTVDALGNNDDFLGHIGGDDFVILTTPGKAEQLAKHLCIAFDRVSPSLYEKQDRDNGYISQYNRRKELVRYPLLTLSIGIVTNEFKKLHSRIQIGQIAAELKQYAKTKPHGKVASCYVKDRRKN